MFYQLFTGKPVRSVSSTVTVTPLEKRNTLTTRKDKDVTQELVGNAYKCRIKDGMKSRKHAQGTMSWEGGACSSKDHHSTGRDHLVDLSDPVDQTRQIMRVTKTFK